MRCFLIEPTDRQKLYLRRYRSTGTEDKKKCPTSYGYHNSTAFIGESVRTGELIETDVYADDPRWPVKCESCDYEFNITDDDDKFQVFTDCIYRRADTGEELGLREWQKIPGAMWNADWMPSAQGGQYLCVICPGGGEWAIDGRASNSDEPRGWKRDGIAPNLTVVPSIVTHNWHGWLRNGEFIPC